MPKIGPKINKIEIWLKSGPKVINSPNQSQIKSNQHPTGDGRGQRISPQKTTIEDVKEFLWVGAEAERDEEST